MICRFHYSICALGMAMVMMTLASCGGPIFPDKEVFRFRWTVKVQVDGKMYVGSSVVEAIQREGSCMMIPQGDYCPPTFVHRGVAPIIRLPGDAMLVPTFRGYYLSSLSKDQDRLDWRGGDARNLPWYLYVPTPWGLSKTKKMVSLPADTPPLEIPFEGHPKSWLKPSIKWVPGGQKLGPPNAHYIGPRTAKKITGLNIQLISFGIAKTEEPLIEFLPDMPSWVTGARGDKPRVSKAEWQRRVDRSRDRNNHWTALFAGGFETSQKGKR